MRKIIIITFGLLLGAMASFAQDVNVKADSNKKCCASVKECAKTMGMTEAECKKVCASKLSDTQTKVAASEATASIVETSTSDKKACGKSIEKCAKDMGISIEECKKRCLGNKVANADTDIETETQVASALSESDVAPVKEKAIGAKKCCSSKKSCKK